MFDRLVDLPSLAARKSMLFLGPRQTGKSTLATTTLKDALYVDLLDAAQFRTLAAHPEQLGDQVREHRRSLGSRRAFVVVDEVQKLPSLLDEVHRLIEADPELRFVLTGSSARKLRTGGVNLLGGRAGLVRLHPIVYPELLTGFDPTAGVERAIRCGGLPSVLTSPDPRRDLLDYVGLYLQEEVRAEGLARSVPAFARFLEVAAATNGEQVVFASVASDAELPARTVRDYYQILEDTLVGHLLPAYRATPKRKAMASAKFYFFDVGVANALLGRTELRRGTPEFGRALEHYVLCELRAALDYLGAEARLSYWRSLSQLEVDFVLEAPGAAPVAIEVKGTGTVSRRDTRGLRALADDVVGLRRIVVCSERRRRLTDDGMEIFPLEEFLAALWAGSIVPRSSGGRSGLRGRAAASRLPAAPRGARAR